MNRFRTIAAVLILCAAAFSSSCRGWPELNSDIKELQKLHATYRAHVVPAVAEEADKVKDLADKIEKIFAHMDTLTQ